MNFDVKSGDNRMVSAATGGLGYTTPTSSGTAAQAPEESSKENRKTKFRQARNKARKAMRRRGDA